MSDLERYGTCSDANGHWGIEDDGKVILSGLVSHDACDAVMDILDERDALKAEVERLQSIHSIDSIGIEQLKAEVERLTADIQMEKENEDRLVREWQRANNEVYGLKTQVAALIDDQTRLKAEVERLTKAGDELAKIRAHEVSLDECVSFSDAYRLDYLTSAWNAAKKGGQP